MHGGRDGAVGVLVVDDREHGVRGPERGKRAVLELGEIKHDLRARRGRRARAAGHHEHDCRERALHGVLRSVSTSWSV
jgi:hypothetical protein